MRIELSNHGFIDIPSSKDLFYLNITVRHQSRTSKLDRYSILLSAIYNVYIVPSNEVLVRPVNIDQAWVCDINIDRDNKYDDMVKMLYDNVHRITEIIDEGTQEVINIPKEITKGMV